MKEDIFTKNNRLKLLKSAQFETKNALQQLRSIRTAETNRQSSKEKVSMTNEKISDALLIRKNHLPQEMNNELSSLTGYDNKALAKQL